MRGTTRRIQATAPAKSTTTATGFHTRYATAGPAPSRCSSPEIASPGCRNARGPPARSCRLLDQPVLAGLASPVEVLQRVGDEEAVSARDHAAPQPHAQDQPGEHRERQRRQRGERARLHGVEAAPGGAHP